ncbi:hypothetical protein [Sphingomonas panni]|uniref:hypothetical protein n=1 Tax=Sphingomonas panni TaxID=237612 RepID=UPI001F5B5DD7|nr:hypothetical protein [Sphingomonas panni]
MLDLPYDWRPGDGATIDDQTYVLDRQDSDGLYRIRRSGTERLFRVPCPKTGLPVLPDATALLALQAEGRFDPLPTPLDDPNAARRRAIERDVRDASAADPRWIIRHAFLTAYDAAPCSLSIRELAASWTALLKSDETIRSLAMRHPRARRRHGRAVAPWMPSDKTLRDWIAHRGAPLDRRAGDCVSDSGRVERVRKLDHPVEIVSHWVAIAHSSRQNVRAVWRRYRAELKRIDRGEPTGRLDEQDRPIHYPRPAKSCVPLGYTSFWRRVMKTRGRDAAEAKRGREAAEKEYGGGGTLERATGVARLGKIDDSPAPSLAKIEIGGSWWVGRPTVSLLHCAYGKGWWGLDLSWEPASSSTVLRTIADASRPKRVPRDMAGKHEDLSLFCARFDRLAMDNLSAHHGRHVTDALREIGTDTDLTGAGRPRDKADTESEIGKLLRMTFSNLPNAVDPIPLRRHIGSDPPIRDIPTLAQMRVVLLRALALHNASPHKGLADRSPLSVLRQTLEQRRLPIIRPMARFLRSIGMVDYDVTLRASGIERFRCLRYVQRPGTPSLYERLRHLERPSNRTVTASVKVKVKYDAGDIGTIHVWDPVSREYATFHCDRPRYATRLPLYLHEQILACIKEDELSTVSEDDLLEWMARLFDEQSAITQAASEEERRRAARLSETAPFKRMRGQLVHVRDEDDGCDDPPSIDEMSHLSDHELACETSVDSTIDPPRGGNGGRGASSKRRGGSVSSGGDVPPPPPRPAPKRRTPAPDPSTSSARRIRPRSPSNDITWRSE